MPQVNIENFLPLAANAEDRDVVILGDARRHIVVGRVRTGGAQHKVGATIPQGDHEVGSFRSNMQTRRNTQVRVRLRFNNMLPNALQHRHRLKRPFDTALAALSEREVSDVTRYGPNSLCGHNLAFLFSPQTRITKLPRSIAQLRAILWLYLSLPS